jgi:hypothetical protein
VKVLDAISKRELLTGELLQCRAEPKRELVVCFDRGASALEVVNHLCLSILQDQGYALVLMS